MLKLQGCLATSTCSRLARICFSRSFRFSAFFRAPVFFLGISGSTRPFPRNYGQNRLLLFCENRKHLFLANFTSSYCEQQLMTQHNNWTEVFEHRPKPTLNTYELAQGQDNGWHFNHKAEEFKTLRFQPMLLYYFAMYLAGFSHMVCESHRLQAVTRSTFRIPFL